MPRHPAGKLFVALVAVPLLLLVAAGTSGVAVGCEPERLSLQVLGSGGPELTDGRASTSYLVWLDGRARALVDAGGGSSRNFELAGAALEDLDVIALTHLHVDHAADLPVYVKGSFFTPRDRDLAVLGPGTAGHFPATSGFARALFLPPGAAFGYLGGYLDPDSDRKYHLVVETIAAHAEAPEVVAYDNERLRLRAVPADHGPVPALAWRVEAAGCAISFTGDMTGRYGRVPVLARGSQLLVAHNAIEEGATGVAARLHMPPSVIGEIAAQADVGALLLSHRMRRTLGREEETLEGIRRRYGGPVRFAEDLDVVTVSPGGP